MEQSLVKVAEQQGLEPSQTESIVGKFKDFFEQAKGWEAKARAIVITDASQTAEMKAARTARLELKGIRVNAEKTRKALKERSLREGRAIDGIANIIEAVIVPIEEHLEAQEKFVERIEQEAKERVYNERVSALAPYIPDTNVYNLREISEGAFQEILRVSKMAYQQRIDAEKKVQEEERARAEAERKAQEQLKIENARLKKEAENREKQAAEERAKIEAQARLEREARERAEKELRAKQEAEIKAKKEAEERVRKEKEAKEEAERQAALAPEKDKLFAYAEAIKAVPSPKGLSKAGQLLVSSVEMRLLGTAQFIKDEIKNL